MGRVRWVQPVLGHPGASWSVEPGLASAPAIATSCGLVGPPDHYRLWVYSVKKTTIFGALMVSNL